jgi:preprotein translocase subunit YajC
VLGKLVKVIEISEFDQLVQVELDDQTRLQLSHEVVRNILVKK